MALKGWRFRDGTLEVAFEGWHSLAKWFLTDEGFPTNELPLDIGLELH